MGGMGEVYRFAIALGASNGRVRSENQDPPAAADSLRPLPPLSAPTAAAAATGAILLGTRFVHGHRATVNLDKIDFLNGLFRLRIVRHFNESKPTGTARFSILDDIHSGHLPIRGKGLLDIVLGRIER